MLLSQQGQYQQIQKGNGNSRHFLKTISSHLGKDSQYISTNKRKIWPLLIFTLRISLTETFSSGMSSLRKTFFTSINSNSTFALRLSWNTTPPTEPSSVFYSSGRLKQLWNLILGTYTLLCIFQHCLMNLIFFLNWREKGVPHSPCNCVKYILGDSSLTGFIYSSAAVSNLFGTRDQFCGRQFSMEGWGGVVSGWFNCIAFIVYVISTIITSAPP